MTFNLSGSTITQSGTDTSLSSLSGISWVTVTNLDNGTDNPYKIYALANRKIIVNGTLTLNPDFELLAFDYNQPSGHYIEVNTGTLNIGREDTVNGAKKPMKQVAIIFTNDDNTQSSEGAWDLEVGSSWTLNFISGIVNSGGAWVFASGSTVNFTNHAHISGITTTTATRSARIRQKSSALSIDADLTIEGSLRFDFFQPPTSIKGWSPKFTSFGGFQAISTGAGGSDGIFKFEDIIFDGLVYLGDAFVKARVQLYNIDAVGKEVLVTHNKVESGLFPGTLIIKEFTTNVFDADDLSSIESAEYYIKDTDNSNRYTSNLTWNSWDTLDSNVDFTYNGITNVSWASATDEIITRIVREGQSKGGTYGATNASWNGSATCITDYRSKNNTHDDKFDMHFFSYLHLQATSIDVVMWGIWETDIQRSMFEDQYITQTNKATVDAYTEISNWDRLYEIQKSWKQDNYTDEYPIINTYLINGSGAALSIASTVSLTIDGSAVSVFAVNQATHTITIDAGTTFATSSKFNTIISDVTIEDATIINGWTIDWDVYLNNANDLTNVIINWDLRINTWVNSILNFNNVTVSWNVYNDDASSTLQINTTNGSSISTTEPGTWNGQVDIQNTITLSVTWLVSWTEVRILQAWTTTELDWVENSWSTFDYIYNYPTWYDVDIIIHHLDYKYQRVDWVTLSSTNSSIPIQQQIDRYYNNP